MFLYIQLKKYFNMSNGSRKHTWKMLGFHCFYRKFFEGEKINNKNVYFEHSITDYSETTSNSQ